jgi:protoporphyrinogen oxidase
VIREKKAIIIGAGPAGLTAAYELLQRSDIRPIVLEATDTLGGISRTVNHRGNRIDIGGHRFFSKSDRVMQWWLDMLPMEEIADTTFCIRYRNQERQIDASSAKRNPNVDHDVMLVRGRKSRIFFLRKFFDYPISLSGQTILNLGPVRLAKILASYLKARAFPIRDESNLEQFFINRFGGELYRTFFKSYTEKVWGVPCHEISAAWGAQRIKGLSITKAIAHAAKKILCAKGDIQQKNTETSLIERFLYPKLGPGQMWETCAKRVENLGGQILRDTKVDRLIVDGDSITAVECVSTLTGDRFLLPADYVFSTMPVKELIRSLDTNVPQNVREVSEGLIYRDFITVGLLAKQLLINDQTAAGKKLLADNWIYIQEPDVKVGRLQIFNNWSPYLVADPSKVWLGMEYFCNEGDELWNLSDREMQAFGVAELASLGFVQHADVIDSTVIRMPKTYPAYFGTYDRFAEIRDYLDPFQNLFLVGRNGMHRYNNQDHSMLTAMVAVDNIIAGRTDKQNIWDVNTEDEYHEEKDPSTSQHPGGRLPPAMPVVTAPTLGVPVNPLPTLGPSYSETS